MSRRTTLKGAILVVWEKLTANNITLGVGTSSETVSDLQIAHDGNVYNLNEAAATPGQNLIVDFIEVPIFHYIRVLGNYDGGAIHSVNIQLWNWILSAWDNWDAMPGIEKTITNHSFFVQEYINYIGTGANSGRVRVRFLHTQMGNVAHDSFFDEVALFRFT